MKENILLRNNCCQTQRLHNFKMLNNFLCCQTQRLHNFKMLNNFLCKRLEKKEAVSGSSCENVRKGIYILVFCNCAFYALIDAGVEDSILNNANTINVLINNATFFHHAYVFLHISRTTPAWVMASPGASATSHSTRHTALGPLAPLCVAYTHQSRRRPVIVWRLTSVKSTSL